jgi:hypothetical protein
MKFSSFFIELGNEEALFQFACFLFLICIVYLLVVLLRERKINRTPRRTLSIMVPTTTSNSTDNFRIRGYSEDSSSSSPLSVLDHDEFVSSSLSSTQKQSLSFKKLKEQQDVYYRFIKYLSKQSKKKIISTMISQRKLKKENKDLPYDTEIIGIREEFLSSISASSSLSSSSSLDPNGVSLNSLTPSKVTRVFIYTKGVSFLHNIGWIIDESCSCCSICYKKFNLFRRKHHCRKCGNIICKHCILNEQLLMTSPTHSSPSSSKKRKGSSSSSSSLKRKLLMCVKCNLTLSTYQLSSPPFPVLGIRLSYLKKNIF